MAVQKSALFPAASPKCGLLNQSHTGFNELLVSFDSEVRISDRRERIRTFGIGTLAYADRMDPANSDRQKDALKDLERLQNEGGLLTGLLRQTTAADRTDPIELWGRRIGRTLAAVAFLAICVYFYLTYVR